MTAGIELFMSGGRSEVSAGAAWRVEQILKNSLRVLMDRFADQDGSHDGPAMENLTFEYKACLHASSLQLEQF